MKNTNNLIWIVTLIVCIALDLRVIILNLHKNTTFVILGIIATIICIVALVVRIINYRNDLDEY